ncbi:MAG TPA: protein-S-isoprenylcysteine O-methyltransferase, partial [Prolixibacteraceae bacterium]
MDRAYLEIIFLCGFVLQVILRSYYVQYYVEEKHKRYFNKKERLFLLFIFVGFQLLPILYVFTTWFSFFDYNLPKWFGFPATMLFGFGIWLFFRAHADLGKYWSPGLEIKEDHQLIVTGVFKWVRHPMYAAFVAIAVSQVFMLQNWIVGPAFLVLAIPFYLHRVQREERQLIRHFGDDYRAYMADTNALFPKKEQIDLSPLYRKLKLPVK